MLVVGVVLAGGRSRRMGRNKALLKLPNGETFLAKTVEMLAQITHRQLIAGGRDDLRRILPAGVLCLDDLHPGAGPLAGVEAALASRMGQGYLVVGCDQPRVDVSLLRKLLAGDENRIKVFGLKGDIVPLPGYFPASAADAATTAIKESDRSLKAFILAQNPIRIALADFEIRMVESINTPGDYQILLMEPEGT